MTGDTNTLEDLFACPAAGGAVQRLSISSSGGQSQKVTGIFTEGGASIAGYPSRDGRYVVFQSNGTGLVPGVEMPSIDLGGTLYPAPNNKLYVRDRVANTTTAIIPVSAASEGSLPVLSADGAIVAFHSPSGVLAVGDTNGRDDIFLAPNPAMAAPAPVSYAAWVTAHPAAADPYADSDHDGLTNFAEFALGLDPFTADAAGATSIDHDPMPTFSYTIDTLAAAEVTAMTSTNLADWTPVLATDATYSATGLPDDFREITLQWTGANAQRRFFRLDIASD